MPTFYELMQTLGLADLPDWTVSTVQKMPLNAKKALAAHFNPDNFRDWLTYAKDPKTELVTLTDLYQEPATPLDKCALHINIDTQKILLMDVEATYDKTVNQYVRKLPVIYGEHSRHGGLHYIAKIPDNVLTDPKYFNLFGKTTVKFGELNGKHTGIELFFHNHYLTFTQNQFPVKTNNGETELRYFLDYLLNNVNTQTTAQQSFIDDTTNIPTDALVVAKHALTPNDLKAIKKYIDNNDTADDSQREYQNVFAIARRIIKAERSHYRAQPFTPGELIEPKAPHDLTILTWALLHMSYELLEYRPKWNETASGKQTYIQYTCNKAISYLLQHDSKTTHRNSVNDLLQ